VGKYGKGKVHIVGVCGTAMAGVAVLLKSKGFYVSGSDSLFYPPMSEQLSRAGIITGNFSPDNVKDADFVVVGNSISRSNPEVQEAISLGKELLSYPDVINLMFGNCDFFVVAGTHGKTTTTSMLAFLLDKAGFSPSFLVGGVPINFGVSAKLGSGDIFVIEGDEYDTAFFDKTPKFWHFKPKRAIIGKVEFDHFDIYKTFDEYKLAFSNFAKLTEEKLSFYLSETNLEIVERAKAKKISFSEENKSDFFPYDIKLNKNIFEGNEFIYSFSVNPLDSLEFKLSIFGIHNILNSIASISLVYDIISPEKISQYLSEFKGVKRRLEVLFSSPYLYIIDDFAHHPTEIESGIRTLKEFFSEVWIAFEPRSYTSRTKIHQEGFKKAFELGDAVFIGKIYREDKIPEEIRLSPDEIVSHLKKKGKYACYSENVADRILNLLDERGIISRLSAGSSQSGKDRKTKINSKIDVAVVFMSSGDFYGERDKFLDKIRSISTNR